MPILWIIGLAIGAVVLYETKGTVQAMNQLANTLIAGTVVVGGLYLVAKVAKVA